MSQADLAFADGAPTEFAENASDNAGSRGTPPEGVAPRISTVAEEAIQLLEYTEHATAESRPLFNTFATSYQQLSRTLTDLLSWKDEVMALSTLPAANLTNLAIMCSELFRSKMELKSTLDKLKEALFGTSFGTFTPVQLTDPLPDLPGRETEKDDGTRAGRLWTRMAAKYLLRAKESEKNRLLFSRAVAERELMRLYLKNAEQRAGMVAPPHEEDEAVSSHREPKGFLPPLENTNGVGRASKSNGSQRLPPAHIPGLNPDGTRNVVSTEPIMNREAFDLAEGDPSMLPPLNPPSREGCVSLGMLPNEKLIIAKFGEPLRPLGKENMSADQKADSILAAGPHMKGPPVARSPALTAGSRSPAPPSGVRTPSAIPSGVPSGAQTPMPEPAASAPDQPDAAPEAAVTASAVAEAIGSEGDSPVDPHFSKFVE